MSMYPSERRMLEIEAARPHLERIAKLKVALQEIRNLDPKQEPATYVKRVRELVNEALLAEPRFPKSSF